MRAVQREQRSRPPRRRAWPARSACANTASRQRRSPAPLHRTCASCLRRSLPNVHRHASGEHDPHLIDRHSRIGDNDAGRDAPHRASRAEPIDFLARDRLEERQRDERVDGVVISQRIHGWSQCVCPEDANRNPVRAGRKSGANGANSLRREQLTALTAELRSQPNRADSRTALTAMPREQPTAHERGSCWFAFARSVVRGVRLSAPFGCQRPSAVGAVRLSAP